MRHAMHKPFEPLYVHYTTHFIGLPDTAVLIRRSQICTRASKFKLRASFAGLYVHVELGCATSSPPPWDDEESSSAAAYVVTNQTFPLIKFGAYLTVLHCAAVSLCVGVLALAPTQIVASMSTIPTWLKALVAAIAFVTLAWQLLGLFCVITDNTMLYRLYIRLNFLATVVLIAITLACAIAQAAQQSKSEHACMLEFEQPIQGYEVSISEVQNKIDDARHTICKIVTWVNVGVGFGVIAVVGLMQLYLCYMQRVYGQHQRAAKDEAFRSEAYSFAPNATTPGWDTQQPLMSQAGADNAHYETYGPGHSYR